MFGVDWSRWKPLFEAIRRCPPSRSGGSASASAPASLLKVVLPILELPELKLLEEPRPGQALPSVHAPICEAAMRAMFTFPAAAASMGYGGSCFMPPGTRYRPEDVPLATMSTTQLVGVCRDLHGDCHAFARVPIPAGSLIGW